jgi:hypothetical protein
MPRRPDDEDPTERFGRDGSAYDGATDPVSGPPAAAAPAAQAAPATSRRRRLFNFGAARSGPPTERERRRRRWFVSGISIGAAIIALALCAGALGVIDAIGDTRERADESREARRQRDVGCLELEKRLNRLIPPGATTGPAARAVAVTDENAAVRIYLGEKQDQWVQDAWRQLLDARTVYADALERQAKSRTPAFFVAPRAADGQALADQLAGRSPAPCAGPIRRLAAPDL